MHQLTKLIKEDMKPALGVTEPGAIAYAVSKARSYFSGELSAIKLILNSGMYKNAYTCGIPNSLFFGNDFAAALGAIAGRPEKELESLSDLSEADNIAAKKLISEGKVKVEMNGISSRIFIEAQVTTTEGMAIVRIRDSHTNIVLIKVNGKIIFSKEIEDKNDPAEGVPLIHNYTLEQIHQYAATVPPEEITFLQAAYDMNYALFEESIHSKRTTFAYHLLEKNNGKIISNDEQKTASLLCNAAIEARVIGLDKPAMSITGMICHGGNKGCTMKGIVAVDAAFRSAEFGMQNIYIDEIHGINGKTPEETMRHIGEIASPGMIGTEKIIVDILQGKND